MLLPRDGYFGKVIVLFVWGRTLVWPDSYQQPTISYDRGPLGSTHNYINVVIQVHYWFLFMQPCFLIMLDSFWSCWHSFLQYIIQRRPELWGCQIFADGYCLRSFCRKTSEGMWGRNGWSTEVRGKMTCWTWKDHSNRDSIPIPPIVLGHKFVWHETLEWQASKS